MAYNGMVAIISIRLVFMSRSSPKIFDLLSKAICWILINNYSVQHVLHLLDDFVTIDNPYYLSEKSNEYQACLRISQPAWSFKFCM